MTDVLVVVHVLVAALATWRIVDLIATDRISAPLRRRLPTWYVLTCVRCLSVWVGAAATLAYVWAPWALWPFALSWIYIWGREWRTGARAAPLRRGMIPMPASSVQERLEVLIGKLQIENAALAATVDDLRAELARRDAATQDANAVRVE